MGIVVYLYRVAENIVTISIDSKLEVSLNNNYVFPVFCFIRFTKVN